MFLPLNSLVMDWVFPLKLSYRIESLRISYSMGIFLALNKIYTNSNKSKSATALLKSNKNHFQNTKINSNLFLSNFLL